MLAARRIVGVPNLQKLSVHPQEVYVPVGLLRQLLVVRDAAANASRAERTTNVEVKSGLNLYFTKPSNPNDHMP